MTIDSIASTLKAVVNDIKLARSKRVNLMDASQFEKDKTPRFVVRSNVIHEIAKRHFRAIKDQSKNDVFAACETLLDSRSSETNVVAIDWATFVSQEYNPKDFARFERWLKKYVRGWGMCDSLCCGPLGILLCNFPELTPRVRPWSNSKSLWLRRASAVALIVSVRNRKAFDLACEISDTLLTDTEDYVQKGYGWLLKEASKEYRREVFDFVMARRNRMPRTALRYAIEKMPQVMRQKAMQRD